MPRRESTGRQDRSEAHQRSAGMRVALASLAAMPLLLTVACRQELPPDPGVRRLFRSEDSEFVTLGERGLWARRTRPPFTLRETVTLPSAARLVLPWGFEETSGDASTDTPSITVTLGIREADAFHELSRATRSRPRRPDWQEETVNLSGHSGPVELEIRFEAADPGPDGSSSSPEIAVSSALLWSTTAEVRKRQPPDVVLVAVDTLRADRLEPYGGERPTPTLASLARSGTLFEQAFSPSSWTLPSFASVFTSRLPSTTGVINADRAIPEELPILGEIFAANGYRTVGSHGGGNIGPSFGFQRGFDEYTFHPTWKELESGILPRIREMGDHPLLLFVHTYDTHAPYTTVPTPYHSLYADPDYVDTREIRGRPAHLLNQEQGLVASLLPEDLKQLRDLYDGEIRYVDDRLAELLADLDRNRFGRERIVVVFSDHGEAFREHGQLGHGGLPWGELARVPLILSGPGVPVGRRVPGVVETLGLLPTLLDLLGIEVDSRAAMEGLSFHPQLAAEPPPNDRRTTVASQAWLRLFAIRTEEWTLAGSQDRRSLYDRRVDPEERRNVIDENRPVAEWLEQKYWEQIRAGGTARAPKIELDEKTQEQLRALGYLN